MCYFVYLGIGDRVDTKELTRSGIEVKDREDAQLPALPPTFAWRSVTEAGCSCSLFKKSDVEGLERKGKAHHWSVTKISRAMKDHLASTGPDPRVTSWIAARATKREPIYLVVNWAGEPITRAEVLLDFVRLRSLPGTVHPNILFKVVPGAA
jgi:hypothetical protein